MAAWTCMQKMNNTKTWRGSSQWKLALCYFHGSTPLLCSSMAIFRTLIRSILKSPKRTTVTRSQHLFPHSVTKSTYAILNPISCASDHRLTSFHSKLFSPACGSISSPSVGPLFLSSPPWMLLQSATPLYLQADVVGSTRDVSSSFLRIVGGSEVRKRVVGGNIGRDGRGDAVVVEDSILNLPNFISISRMVSGPVIGWMIINEWYSLSFVALGISGFTDWLDGFAARKMKINSVIGSYLDPLADKVLIASVALAMVKKDLLDAWLVELVVLRDVGLVGGAVYKRASSLDWKWKSWSDFISLNTTCPQKVEPLFISKVNTVLQLTLVAAALLQPGFGTEETQVHITYLSWLVASTTVASTIAYGAQHLRTAASVSAK